jgi:hypothetical protein
MVAKASWLTVEPQIGLAAYLAEEETQFFPHALSWMPDDWTMGEDDFEVRCGDDEASEDR